MKKENCYISIKCTSKKEILGVLKELHRCGFKWGDYTSLKDKKIEYLNKLNPCYLNTYVSVVTFSNYPTMNTIVSADKFLKNSNQTVVIFRNGNKVVAKRKTGEIAEAKCHPDDEFDFATGAKIALDRLFEGKRTEEVPANDEATREYERKKAELLEKRSAAFTCKEKVNKTIRQLSLHFKSAYIDDDLVFMCYDGLFDTFDRFTRELKDLFCAHEEYKKLSDEYGIDIEPDLKGNENDKD